MSKREEIQQELTDYLVNKPYFSAPYGVIAGMQKAGQGKVRTITFGVSRYLDATIYIWSVNNITVAARGALAYKFGGKYSSAQELINHFNKQLA